VEDDPKEVTKGASKTKRKTSHMDANLEEVAKGASKKKGKTSQVKSKELAVENRKKASKP